MAFYHAVLTKQPRPQFSWTFVDDDTIRVTTREKPVKVNVWQATNPASARLPPAEHFGPGLQQP